MVDLCQTHGLRPFRKPALELRRGSLIIAVLAQLREEHYGYALRKALADQGMEIEESTLYRCCGGWKPRGCSRANGARKTSAIKGFTASRRTGRASSSSCSRNGTA